MKIAQALSGFPEWLPEQQRLENHIINVLTDVYELFGYTPLHLSSVERIDTLTSKGVEHKEVYTLGRLSIPPQEQKDWELGLHFDLTVPFARYVCQNRGQLQFPFKRYQIQKVWRGERPQKGRYREFSQADIDVVGDGDLPHHYEAEMPLVILEVFQRLGLNVCIHLNHRKVLVGLCELAGVPSEKVSHCLRELDKLEKIGPDKVLDNLTQLDIGLKPSETIMKYISLSGPLTEIMQQLAPLASKSEQLQAGLNELEQILPYLESISSDQLIFNLGIVRGLDYYTGCIYETSLLEAPELGSICSGGRYDNLSQQFGKHHLPGVGISIGLTRLVYGILSKQLLPLPSPQPTQAVIVIPEAKDRVQLNQLASSIRNLGVSCEVFPKDGKSLGKQLQHLDKRGIPWAIFPHLWLEDHQTIEVKELASQSQTTTNLKELKSILV